jgi:uncharacterized repeat protein (TIGR01451 family)
MTYLTMKILLDFVPGGFRKVAIACGLLAGLLSATAVESNSNPLVYGSHWSDDQGYASLNSFRSWAEGYVASPEASRAKSLSQGVLLAQKRRAAFQELIKADPQKALALTVPATLRQQLPVEVQAELETPVSGIGDLIVLGALQAKGGPTVVPIRRSVVLNGTTYEAYVFGRRLSQTSKQGVPLHGVALNGSLALAESVLRLLDSAETMPAADTIVDMTIQGAPAKAAAVPVFAEMGSVVYRFSSIEDFKQAELKLETNERGLQPYSERPAADVLKSGISAAPASDSSTALAKGDHAKGPLTAWTSGLKKVLVIRVDFSDLPGDPTFLGGPPVTAAYAQNLMDTDVSTYYVTSSYGQTSFTNTVTTQLYRMPQTAAQYAQAGANDVLHADAEAAATADYPVATYDRIIVVFSFLGSIPGSLINYGGLANLGGKNVWVNGEFDFRVVVHELGHTYGLFHAGYYQVTDGNPISATGTTVEYGDDFDTMGANFADDRNVDFSPFYKNNLGWINDSQVKTITTNGVYRIYAFDWRNTSNALSDATLALKMQKDSERTYWIGLRRNFTTNPYMENGVYVIWGLATVGGGAGGGFQSDLLDMNTPGTAPITGVNADYDAALEFDQPFFDPSINFLMTPIGLGGSAPNTYADVQIGAGGAAPLDLSVLTNYVTGGNANSVIDTNECTTLSLVLTNSGGVGATNIHATLSTSTRDVFVTQPSSDFPNLPPLAMATNLVPFTVSIAPTFVCGTPIDLSLAIKSDQGTVTNQYRMTTGVPGTAIRFDSYAAIPIPDAGQTNSLMLVSNIDFAVSKVTVSLFINHTFDSDLTLKLIGPDGTTTTLSANNGSSGQNYGLFCSPDSSRTTFDDNAAQAITSGTPPFLGSWRPEEPLSVFSGKSGTNINGVWQLSVADGVRFDVGTIQCWSLSLSPSSCTDGGGECPGSDLSIGMTAAPEPVVVGNNLIYTISVTNNGPASAKNVSASQILPSDAVYVAASTSQGSAAEAGGVVTANLGRLGGGNSATVSVVVQPVASGLHSSSATVSSEQPDFIPSNNGLTIYSQFNPTTADLAVGLFAAPPSVVVGETVTCTLSVTNNGPSPASGVVVTNILPAGLALLNETISQGSLSVNGNQVVCYFGAVASGGRATATLTLSPTTTGTLPVVANLNDSPNQFDPVRANNVSAAVVSVGASADVALSLVAVPNPAVYSSNFTFLATVRNNGPSTGSGIVMHQNLPRGLTIISTNVSQGVASLNGTNFTWNLGTLAAGGEATAALVVKTPLLGLVSSSAGVAGTESDPDLSNNSAAVDVTVALPFVQISSAGASLVEESFSPPDGSIEIGERVTLQLRLQNVGNVANTNLVATLLPTDGVTSPTGPQTYGVLQPVGVPGGVPVSKAFSFTASGTNGGSVVATLQLKDGTNTLAPVTFTFVLPSVTTFANNGPIFIPNLSRLSGSGSADPYPASIAVSGVAGQVGKVTTTLLGFTHTYVHDISALLVGPTGARTLLMSHAAPDYFAQNIDLTFDDQASSPLPFASGGGSGLPTSSWQPTAYAPSPVLSNPAPAGPYTAALATFGGLNPTGTWSLYILDDSDGDIGVITNGWSLSFSGVTPVNQVADLGLAVVASTNSVLAGDYLTCTFTIKNSGPSAASGVTFSNYLPASVTLVSASVSQGNIITNIFGLVGNLATLNTGASATVTTVIRPKASAAGQFVDMASVSAFEADLHTVDNVASVLVSVGLPSADVAIGLIPDPAAVTTGSNVTYTITVTNAGPQLALDVTVTDPLPAATSFVGVQASQGSATVNGGVLTAVLGDIAPGASATVDLVLAPQSAGTITNTASVATSSTDAIPGNNTAAATVTASAPGPRIVPAGTALLAENRLQNQAIDPGETVTILFSLANTGVLDTANLVATLQPYANLIPVTSQAAYGAVLAGGPSVARSFTFTAASTATSNIVATFQLQDGANNLGTVAFTFPLPVTRSFSAGGSIAIPDHGPGSPYPATIIVSGLTGSVTKVTAVLQNLTHSFPSDVNALLVSPDGNDVLLISHNGSGHAVTNVTLTFDDDAASLLPAKDQIVSGSYRPSRFGAAVSFPATAPAPPYGATLAALNGSNPNGTWSLFILDDATGDSGSIANGWALNLTSVVAIPSVSIPATLSGVFVNGVFQLTVTGQPGQSYIVQASGDLSSWSPVLTTNAPSNGTFTFADPASPSVKTRYYRTLQGL